MLIKSKKVIAIAILALAVMAWGTFEYLHHPKKPLLIFTNTTGGILVSSEGRVTTPGSMAVVARDAVIFRVYMIEKGEQLLKETIQFDPKDIPVIYFTPCVTSQEGAALVVHAQEVVEREPIYRAISFPIPVSMGSGNCYGHIPASEGGERSHEYLCFEFALSWTEKGAATVTSIDDMKMQSKSVDRPCSYLAVTCEMK
jgi:hypothetical protein